MISVIIPVYNVGAYLETCLRSILSNTYGELEVICVNDGSTDCCPEILRKWEGRDSRIVVIDQENRGLPGARNSGLEAASGDYVAFIDADDWVHPRYFESLLDCMEKNAADMVVCQAQKVDPGEEIAVDLDLAPQYRRMTARGFFGSFFARHMIWARLIRRRDAEKLRFPPEVLPQQDTLYNLRLVGGWKQPVVYGTETALYFYLQRPGSLIRSHTYRERLEFIGWYMKNERGPARMRSGAWGWMLLLQTISTTLVCRYDASLHQDGKSVRWTNDQLRVLGEDLKKEPHVPVREKLPRIIMICSPRLYRRFRLLNDPSLKEYERKIREAGLPAAQEMR